MQKIAQFLFYVTERSRENEIYSWKVTSYFILWRACAAWTKGTKTISTLMRPVWCVRANKQSSRIYFGQSSFCKENAKPVRKNGIKNFDVAVANEYYNYNVSHGLPGFQ